MGNSGVVVDTSVFIEYLRAKNKKQTTLYRSVSKHNIYISSITLYELLMGATNNQKLQDVKLLTEDVIILPFDQEASQKSGEIYHKLRSSNKMIDFRDLFIAATCLIHNLPIKTLNIKHFKRVSGLKTL